MLIRFLKAVLPMPMLERAHNTLVFGLSDLADVLLGRRRDLVPPRRLVFTGGGDYVAAGDEFLKHFQHLAGLAPDAVVLDVGSGIGRMARPLTSFLQPTGRYEGFDIDASGVAWCKKNITSRFPNFNFRWADIYNKRYNPSGKEKSRNFRFPYADGTFDFVFATSVFTHMFPEDVSHYLQEIARILKPGGCSFVTCFLLNPESLQLISAGQSTQHFNYEVGECLTIDKQVPESSIGLPEEAVKQAHGAAGLAVQSVSSGSWCGRKTFVSYQDIVVSRKR
jgi:SAM-dependent methyltransferase